MAILERDGLLLMSDAVLPSVASLVAGEPIHGSWWGHRSGGEIYRLSNRLADEPYVLLVKLVSSKKTFVHRRLWPPVVAVASSRDSWQLDGLAEGPLALLRLVDEVGSLAWDDVPRHLPPDGRSPTEAVRTLDKRLLVHTSEVHTPTGAHARNLDSWSTWTNRAGLSPPLPDAATARGLLESILDDLNDIYAARAQMPWQSLKTRGVRATRG
jgi:hypothetical protein